MRLRDRTTGQLYSLFEIQQKFSNTSFPQVWDETTYEFANVDPVTTVPYPSVHKYNRADYVGVQFIDGIWTDVWIEVPRYDDPTEQADWIIACTESRWEEIRVQRNQLLSQSDWTQLNDVPLTAEQKAQWVTYRQQLRDITNQANPEEIEWPAVPE